ncbi:hypothetical protein [Intrasporangium calvum]|uniref:hypothetical protein n=1 Tax=Intrasporangium calvum TaxID=53358 RepID=UPI0002D87280|nr:hypothetical protein [Intrasporangium calvum]
MARRSTSPCLKGLRVARRGMALARELAAAQRVRSLDLLADGIIDRIVAEHPDAADEPQAFCLRMSQAIQHELATLAGQEPAARLARYRRL